MILFNKLKCEREKEIKENKGNVHNTKNMQSKYMRENECLHIKSITEKTFNRHDRIYLHLLDSVIQYLTAGGEKKVFFQTRGKHFDCYSRKVIN